MRRTDDLDNEKTFHREKRALLEAAKEFGLEEGSIISGNLKEHLVEDGIAISILPVWEFLLLNQAKD